MKRIIKKIVIITLLLSFSLETIPVYALTKNETIYANLDPDGTVNNVTVSEELKDLGTDKIQDKTKLHDIKNTNGSESFHKDNGNIVWENKGNNILYQGTTKEELPIDLEIKYYLNDQEYEIKDILGKKGKVKIVIKYENKLSKTVIINGKATTLYTPFVVITSSIIPNENNKNITITNGKVMNNGNNSILVSLTSPGLYESLEYKQLKDLDKTIISYDTDSFELSPIYSIATNKILEKDDLDIFDDMDELYSSINKLVSSSNKLVNGSEKILTGAYKIKDGTKELEYNIYKAYYGSKTINKEVKKSIEKIKNNKSDAIDDKTLKYIVKSSKETARKELESQKQSIIDNAKEEAEKATELTDEQKVNIANQTLALIKESEEYKELEGNYNTYAAAAEQAGNAYKELMEAYEEYLANGEDDEASGALINANSYKTKMEAATKAATTYKTMMTIMEETAKKTAVNTASTVSKQVATTVAGELADELSTKITESVAEKVSGSVSKKVGNTVKETILKETYSSLTSLSNGLEELTSGLEQLDNGAKTLYDGTKSLKDGIKELNNGLKTFDKEGIDKIANFVNDDIKTLQEKIENLEKISEEYQTFDDKKSDTNGESKLIMIIDEAKKEEKKKEKTETTKVEKKKSLWEKIKDLFK